MSECYEEKICKYNNEKVTYDESRGPGEKEITKERQKDKRFRRVRKKFPLGKTIKSDNEYFQGLRLNTKQ